MSNESIVWDYGLFDWRDLDGKVGEIHVGVDHSCGEDYTAVIFTDETEASYLIYLGKKGAKE